MLNGYQMKNQKRNHGEGLQLWLQHLKAIGYKKVIQLKYLKTLQNILIWLVGWVGVFLCDMHNKYRNKSV